MARAMSATTADRIRQCADVGKAMAEYFAWAYNPQVSQAEVAEWGTAPIMDVLQELWDTAYAAGKADA